jgi:hypothetical protein
MFFFIRSMALAPGKAMRRELENPGWALEAKKVVK